MSIMEDYKNAFAKQHGKESVTDAEIAQALLSREYVEREDKVKICLSNGDMAGAAAILGIEPAMAEPVVEEPTVADAEPEVDPIETEMSALAELIESSKGLSKVEKLELALKLEKIKEMK